MDDNRTTFRVLVDNGHYAISVNEICKLIGIPFKKQDSLIKLHPMFSQVYHVIELPDVDGKVRKDNALPIIDAYAWIASINNIRNKTESMSKQLQLMAEIRNTLVTLMYDKLYPVHEPSEIELDLMKKRAIMASDLSYTTHRYKNQFQDLLEIESEIEKARANKETTPKGR